MSTTNQSIVDDNAALLETFVTRYLLDNGIAVQLTEVVTRELFGQSVVINGVVLDEVTKAPSELVTVAIRDVANVGLFGDVTYDSLTVIAGAPSLEFLVRYARKVNPAVFPPEVIPSDEVVSAALALFHEMQQAAVNR